jgi:hypothetical protein
VHLLHRSKKIVRRTHNNVIAAPYDKYERGRRAHDGTPAAQIFGFVGRRDEARVTAPASR